MSNERLRDGAVVDLVMTGDSAYLWPLGVAMHSLAVNASRSIRFHYAVPEDWPSVLRQAEIDLVQSLAESLGWTFHLGVSPIRAADLPSLKNIGPMTFLKPAFFDIAQAPILHYIDSDTIAVGPWEGMSDYLGDAVLAATNESNMGYFEKRWRPEIPMGWYFNAGVMAVNSQKWRQEITPLWRRNLAQYQELEFEFLDQDVMNAAILGQTDFLPKCFNVRPTYGDSLDGAAIIHYAGRWKPWMAGVGTRPQLSGSERIGFDQYVVAEQQLLNHVGSFLPNDWPEWKGIRKRLRGRLSWRAQWNWVRPALRKVSYKKT